MRARSPTPWYSAGPGFGPEADLAPEDDLAADAMDDPDRDPAAEPDPVAEPPAWTTRDGDVLVLPRAVGSWWLPGVRNRGRLLRGLRAILPRARRLGFIRARRPNARYRVYGSRVGGRSFRIVARPRGRELEIELVRPAPSRPAAGTGSAVARNRSFAAKLGWGAHLGRIAKVVGFTGSPADGEGLARAVGAWQQKQGMAGDGVIGPGTWTRLQRAISEPILSRVPPPDRFRPVPLSRPGGGRVPEKEKKDPAPDDILWVLHTGGKGMVPLHREAARALVALQKAAQADGIRPPLLRPSSGYRSSAHQQVLWERALRKYGSPAIAKKWVAPPGSSAHQSGRAIDFYLGGPGGSENVGRLRKLPAYHWMVRNAARFGFYPYPAEPWHWEYNPPAAGASELEIAMAEAGTGRRGAAC